MSADILTNIQNDIHAFSKGQKKIAAYILSNKIEAAFTIGRTETNEVSISARSLGSTNVKKIMQLLGGGGHKNEAAAQLTGTTVEEVKQKLIEIIKR